MKVIVDTNVVFSAILNSNSSIGQIILHSNKSIKFYSPKFLQFEIKKHLDSKQIQIIKDFVDRLIITDNSITPIDLRYSKTAKSKYWGATCPYCNSLRGNNFISDYRMEFLHDLECRINKNLQYYTFELNVDHALIEALNNGFEACPHTCIMWWERTGNKAKKQVVEYINNQPIILSRFK